MLGHLLVISTGSEVIALDVMRFQHDADAAILWRQEVVSALESDAQRSFALKLMQTPIHGDCQLIVA